MLIREERGKRGDCRGRVEKGSVEKGSCGEREDGEREGGGRVEGGWREGRKDTIKVTLLTS